ncbi:MAG: hypothetical protein NTZ87_02500 [Candidatus Nomurabacteria bacterium]|nr:hypothetical protein [Candidatus Nomurabacteria bacterium]
MKKAIKKTIGKYVTENTFEKHMGNIANSFARVDASLETHEKVLQEILKEIKAIHEDNKYFRESILSLNTDGISCDKKINNLTVRVEKLELESK